jgi:NAD(P)-dependent dehydrogenase (short-subunit alcohol dehydrogenase family)
MPLPTPAPSATAFADSVVVITGAASGIGQATAEAFVSSRAPRCCSITMQHNSRPQRRRWARRPRCMVTWHGGQDCQQRRDVPGQGRRRHTGQLGHQPRCQRQGHRVDGSEYRAAAAGRRRRSDRQSRLGFRGYFAQPHRWTYNASKGAILALTRCQALDLARDNIRVNSVSPGTIWTPELDRMTHGDCAG